MMIGRGIWTASICLILVDQVNAQEAQTRDVGKIVGTWVRVEVRGGRHDASIEFAPDGKCAIRQGKSTVMQGVYAIVGDALMIMPLSGNGFPEVNTIKTLSADKLIVVDASGTEMEFIREAELRIRNPRSKRGLGK